MANSLKAKFKKLHRDGRITSSEFEELCEKLEGHDREIKSQQQHRYKIDFFTPGAAEWLGTFDTDSATECFTAVQELKKIIEGEEPCKK